ncbi:MAG: hypothetical protein IJ570_05260 [Prevotella sp.]|nr:hypothetical protein [Prevotella sp.]
MKKTFFALTTLVLVLAACDMKAPLKVGYEAPADLEEDRDSTIYGFCGPASTQKVLQLITSTDDTLYINVENARKNNRVMAGYHRGDEIYVLPDADHSQALLTINKNSLLGEWVMPSPYDGSSPAGIVLKDGGEAESFEQQGDILYKSWRIYNGRLQVVEARDYDSSIDYTQTYDIIRMTGDSLYLKNEEESYEYGRYAPEPEEDLGIELDYNTDEDYDLF